MTLLDPLLDLFLTLLVNEPLFLRKTPPERLQNPQKGECSGLTIYLRVYFLGFFIDLRDPPGRVKSGLWGGQIWVLLRVLLLLFGRY